MAANTADAILTRFPGPVTLTISRFKALLVLAGSLGFVAVCIFLLKFAEDDPEAVIAAWAGLAFFGLCTVVAAVMVLPGAGSLTLDGEGFEMCSLFRRHRTPWSRASRFTVGTLPDANRRMVAYDDDALTGFAAETSRKLLGRSAALPDTYRLSHDELARLLTQWREHALRQSHHSPVPHVAQRA